MPACRRQLTVSIVAAVAWVAVGWLLWVPPDPTDALRLPFFTVLGVAIGSTSLAALPWMLAELIRDNVLLYTAGLLHGEARGRRSARDERMSVVR